MKPSEGKIKRPRVLANTVKKQERNANSSGNKSFFNKSTNHYVADLRRNNTKLAHSIALEKRKSAELLRRYNQSQTALLREQHRSRSASELIQTGTKQINDSLTYLVMASESFTRAKELLQSGVGTSTALQASVAPVRSVGNQEAGMMVNPARLVTSSAGNLNCPQQSDSAVPLMSCAGGNESRVTTSVVRQCTARPMIQGQVISKPSVSLQRVTIPTRPLGRGTVKPARGVVFGYPSRLSEIPEQMNESSEARSSLRDGVGTEPAPGSSAVLSLSDTTSTRSLRPSHVLLERLASESGFVHSESSLNHQYDDDQLTTVHFGNMAYTQDFPSASPIQSRTWDTVIRNCRSSLSSAASPKPQSSSSNSDEFESESSSEDENLALQIAESKKCYLEGYRQVEFKEGTSWNYDEKGKFRKRPPRKRKATKAAKSRGKGPAVTPTKSKRASKPVGNEVPEVQNPDIILQSKFNNSTHDTTLKHHSKTPPKQRSSHSTPLQAHTPKSPPISVAMSPILNSTTAYSTTTLAQTSPNREIFSRTIIKPVDMSFTCEVPEEERNSLQKMLDSLKLPQCTGVVPLEGRKVYVTQRSRPRKAASSRYESSDKSLSPLSKSHNSRADCIGGIRDISASPQGGGCHVEASVLNNHNELPPRSPFVVLERLPSTYVSGSNVSVPSSNHLDSISPTSKQDLARKSYESDSSDGWNVPLKFRKRALHNITSSTDDDSDDGRSHKSPAKPKSKRVPKKLRKKRQDSKSPRTSEVPEDRPSSANSSLSNASVATSESFASIVDLSSDGAGRSRPRRNAAPVNMKEPKLSGKMRRP